MRLIMVGLSLMLIAGLASAADQAATVSLQFTDADITEVLASISQQAQVSVVADATVKGKVGLSVSGVSVADSLDMVCKPNKLEWYKAYTGVGTEKPSAGKLFKLMDALKDLGGSALICEDPKNQAQTIFVPNTGTGSVDNSAIASQLKLKEIYLIRAIPDPAAIQAEKDKAKSQTNALATVPSSDPQVAAQQVYGYFTQMPMQQAMDTMHQLRHMFYDNMTPEQRDQMRQSFQQQGGPDGRGDRRNRDNNQPQQ